jgi:hypothetical protein
MHTITSTLFASFLTRAVGQYSKLNPCAGEKYRRADLHQFDGERVAFPCIVTPFFSYVAHWKPACQSVGLHIDQLICEFFEQSLRVRFHLATR